MVTNVYIKFSIRVDESLCSIFFINFTFLVSWRIFRDFTARYLTSFISKCKFLEQLQEYSGNNSNLSHSKHLWRFTFLQVQVKYFATPKPKPGGVIKKKKGMAQSAPVADNRGTYRALSIRPSPSYLRIYCFR